MFYSITRTTKNTRKVTTLKSSRQLVAAWRNRSQTFGQLKEITISERLNGFTHGKLVIETEFYYYIMITDSGLELADFAIKHCIANYREILEGTPENKRRAVLKYVHSREQKRIKRRNRYKLERINR